MLVQGVPILQATSARELTRVFREEVCKQDTPRRWWHVSLGNYRIMLVLWARQANVGCSFRPRTRGFVVEAAESV